MESFLFCTLAILTLSGERINLVDDNNKMLAFLFQLLEFSDNLLGQLFKVKNWDVDLFILLLLVLC
jgi:hypothetical protein